MHLVHVIGQCVGIFANINVQLFYKTWMLKNHIYWDIVDLTLGPIMGVLKQCFKHLYWPFFLNDEDNGDELPPPPPFNNDGEYVNVNIHVSQNLTR